jgi:SAM-dependent methyltransferase
MRIYLNCGKRRPRTGKQSVSLHRYGRRPTDSPTTEKSAPGKTDGSKRDYLVVREPLVVPFLLVRKKNAKLRFCVDYRKLNDITNKDCFPLPRRDDTVDTLAGAKWFSTLDSLCGYWQVYMHPDEQEKTAFSTGQGLCQFTFMHFGLCNDPAIIERLMETVLLSLTYDSCLIYLDDVIVIGRNFEEHLLNLRKRFQWFREACLKRIPLKSISFCRRNYGTLGILYHLKRYPPTPRNWKLGENGQHRRISTKLESFWAYAHVTDGLFLGSVIL